MTHESFGGGLETRQAVTHQLRETAPVLIAVWVLSLAAFAIVCYLHFQDRVLAYQLIDDPAPFAGLAPCTGLMSNIGVLIWCAAAAVCGFCGATLRGVPGKADLSTFLLILGGFNAWLGMDDLLVLHEEAAEALFGFESRHVGEGLLFLAYGVIVAIGYAKFRAIIWRSDIVLLAAAAASFGISIALDVVLQLNLGGYNIFLEAVLSQSWGGPVADISEELLKLNGVLLWFIYLYRMSYRSTRDAMRLHDPGGSDRASSRVPKPQKKRSRRF